MTLPRDQVVKGFTEDLAAFGALVRSLEPDELGVPTRCEGWSTGDVAAHVIGGLADVVGGRFDGLGTPEVTARQVAERRGRTAEELATELDEVAIGARGLLDAFDEDAWNAPAPAGLASTVGSGVEALWYDAFLHGDDVRAAIGKPSVRGEGIRASVSHIAEILTSHGWEPATIALDGIEPFEVSGGGGRTVGGDALAFILVATGRADPTPLDLDETVNIYR
jgi:uncharacterized protein (TIGR03083 family)